MTDEQITVIRTHIENAHQVISDLCQRKRAWTMTIPADPDYDPDLVIGQALRDGLDMAAEIARLKRELANTQNLLRTSGGKTNG